MKTQISIEAEISVKTDDGVIHRLNVDNIPCTWVWDDGSRVAAEYWAVCDWIINTFGGIKWFTIHCVTGSPIKE